MWFFWTQVSFKRSLKQCIHANVLSQAFHRGQWKPVFEHRRSPPSSNTSTSWKLRHSSRASGTLNFLYKATSPLVPNNYLGYVCCLLSIERAKLPSILNYFLSVGVWVILCLEISLSCGISDFLVELSKPLDGCFHNGSIILSVVCSVIERLMTEPGDSHWLNVCCHGP